jgi:hypothetical protein
MALFPVMVLRAEDAIPTDWLPALTHSALRWHMELNPHRVPYSRPDRRSLDTLAPLIWRPVFDVVRAKVRDHFKCEVAHLEGRESVLWNGTHLPVHVEKSDLSGMLWLDYSAKADPAKQDFNGLFQLDNPSGPIGFKKLPWEERGKMVEPKPGTLILHPSYIHHYVYPYQGERPGVEIHFEITLKA